MFLRKAAGYKKPHSRNKAVGVLLAVDAMHLRSTSTSAGLPLQTRLEHLCKLLTCLVYIRLVYSEPVQGFSTLLLTKYKAHLVLAHRVGFFQLRRQMTACRDYRYSHLTKSRHTSVFNTPYLRHSHHFRCAGISAGGLMARKAATVAICRRSLDAVRLSSRLACNSAICFSSSAHRASATSARSR